MMTNNVNDRRRRWKYRIKANHGCETPSNFIFLASAGELTAAAEPMKNVSMAHRFQLAYLRRARFERGKWTCWADYWADSPERVWAWCQLWMRKKEPTWIFAHNWQFQSQLCQFWQQIDSGKFSLTLPRRVYIDKEGNEKTIGEWNGMCAVDGKVFVVYAVCPSGCAKLVDVKNYFDMPLADIAKSFGIGCAGDESLSVSGDGVRQRLEYECAAIVAAMTGTISAWKAGDRGNWQPTAARLAWSNFRHEYVETDKEVKERKAKERLGIDCSIRAKYSIDTVDERHDREFQRRSFYGGRCSHWFRGQYDGAVFKVDVTGLYPSIMRGGLFPTSVKAVGQDDGFRPIGPPLHASDSIGEVEVWGCADLPLRAVDGRIEYPQGIFRTVLAGPELEYAWRNNRIRQWFRWVEFQCEPIFARYVEYWQAIRTQATESGNVAESLLAKTCMNCLFGVFAKRRPRWVESKSVDPGCNWGFFFAPAKGETKLVKHRSVGGMVQMELGHEERDDTLPAVSAFVAAGGRMYMDNVRLHLPEKSVLLQQTDSFLLTEQGYEELKSTIFWGPGSLGRFRCVDRIDGCFVWGGNHYRKGDGECLAGCPEDRQAAGENRWETRRAQTVLDVIGRGPQTEVGQVEGEFVIGPQKSEREFGLDGWAYM